MESVIKRMNPKSHFGVIDVVVRHNQLENNKRESLRKENQVDEYLSRILCALVVGTSQIHGLCSHIRNGNGSYWGHVVCAARG